MKGEGGGGASESAVHELPQGRRKALHQKTHKGEKREMERRKGNKTEDAAMIDVLLFYFFFFEVPSQPLLCSLQAL